MFTARRDVYILCEIHVLWKYKHIKYKYFKEITRVFP